MTSHIWKFLRFCQLKCLLEGYAGYPGVQLIPIKNKAKKKVSQHMTSPYTWNVLSIVETGKGSFSSNKHLLGVKVSPCFTSNSHVRWQYPSAWIVACSYLRYRHTIQSEVTGLGLFLVGLDLVAILPSHLRHSGGNPRGWEFKKENHRTQYGYPPVRLIGLVIKARQLGPEWIGLNDPCMEGFHHDLKDAKRQANAVLVDALAFFFYVESAVLACRFSRESPWTGRICYHTLLRQNSFRRQVLCDAKKSNENEKLPQFYGVPRQMLVASGATIRYYPPPLETQPRSQPVFPPSTAVAQPKWVGVPQDGHSYRKLNLVP